MTVTVNTPPAVRVRCCGEGFAPVLLPGEYCKDGFGLWHFRSPDGAVFACGGPGSKTRVREVPGGISMQPESPEKASLGFGRVVTNVWTVEGAVWVYARDPAGT